MCIYRNDSRPALLYRKDECLSVQTATVVPRDDLSLHADFDAKFKSYTCMHKEVCHIKKFSFAVKSILLFSDSVVNSIYFLIFIIQGLTEDLIFGTRSTPSSHTTEF